MKSLNLIVDDDTSDNKSMKYVSDKKHENLEDFERLSWQYRSCQSALHQREDSIATVNYLSTNERAVVRLPIIISPPMRRQYWCDGSRGGRLGVPGVRRQHLRGRDDQLRGVLPLVPLLLCRGRPRGRLCPVRGEPGNYVEIEMLSKILYFKSYMNVTYKIVKLREREGHRVDSGSHSKVIYWL